jgi:hypothetical protein
MLVITTSVRPGQTLTAAAAEVILTVPHFLRDLSVQGKGSGISHSALATVPHINNLGRYGDAVPPSKDALEMREEALGNEHHNVSRSISENDIIDFQQTPHGSKRNGMYRHGLYKNEMRRASPVDIGSSSTSERNATPTNYCRVWTACQSASPRHGGFERSGSAEVIGPLRAQTRRGGDRELGEAS